MRDANSLWIVRESFAYSIEGWTYSGIFSGRDGAWNVKIVDV